MLTAYLVFQKNTHSIETTSVDRCCVKTQGLTSSVSSAIQRAMHGELAQGLYSELLQTDFQGQGMST